MDVMTFIKALVDDERSSVVICDLNHTIVYMNKFAKEKHHKDLTGTSLMNCHNEDSRKKIEKTIEWFKESKNHNQVYEFHNEKENRDGYMVALRDADGNLIGYWEKHMYRNADNGKFYDYHR